MSHLIEIVDENENIIDIKSREEVYSGNLGNFRVINAFLINPEGKLWIPRRSASRPVFPLCLDTSVGGHLIPTETYDKAFAREVLEEVGIDVNTVDWCLRGKLTPKNDGVSAFMQVYDIKYADEPKLNPEVFVDSYWLYPQEILDKLKFGDKSKSDLPIIIRKLYLQ